MADREKSADSTRRRHSAGFGASAIGSTPEFVSYSSEETIAKGREIAANLRPPAIVMLSGELGSGKTTLTKGIISGLGAAKEEDVTSPTFTLVHVFQNDSLAGSPSELRVNKSGPRPDKIPYSDAVAKCDQASDSGSMYSIFKIPIDDHRVHIWMSPRAGGPPKRLQPKKPATTPPSSSLSLS